MSVNIVKSLKLLMRNLNYSFPGKILLILSALSFSYNYVSF
jgi:hypothetical protein